MQQVIYADVLVIINIFVTYGILRLVGIVCHSEKKQLMLPVASFLSGIYSLIILPDIPDYLIILSRFPMGAVLVIMSFRIYNPRHFVRLYSCFFVVNFLFAGLMFALWYLFAPKGMYFNNGIVYFKRENGMKIIAMGKVSVFPRDGAYQLYCTAMAMDGVGDL